MITLVPLLLAAGCGRPIDESTSSALPPTDFNDAANLDARVGLAISTIRGPGGGLAVADLLANRRLAIAMEACLGDVGFEYNYTGDIEIRPSMLVRPGVTAEWWDPPDPATAARGGFGRAFDTVAFDQAHGYLPDEKPLTNMNYVESLPPERLTEYEIAVNKCLAESAEDVPIPYADVERLLSNIGDIAGAAKKSPGFGPLAKDYRNCVSENGYSFDSPEDALAAEDVMEPGALADYDRAAAVVDAKCRAPLYADFIRLSADQWETWLTESATDVAELAATWQALVDESQVEVPWNTNP